MIDYTIFHGFLSVYESICSVLHYFFIHHSWWRFFNSIYNISHFWTLQYPPIQYLRSPGADLGLFSLHIVLHSTQRNDTDIVSCLAFSFHTAALPCCSLFNHVRYSSQRRGAPLATIANSTLSTSWADSITTPCIFPACNQRFYMGGPGTQNI